MKNEDNEENNKTFIHGKGETNQQTVENNTELEDGKPNSLSHDVSVCGPVVFQIFAFQWVEFAREGDCIGKLRSVSRMTSCSVSMCIWDGM